MKIMCFVFIFFASLQSSNWFHSEACTGRQVQYCRWSSKIHQDPPTNPPNLAKTEGWKIPGSYHWLWTISDHITDRYGWIEGSLFCCSGAIKELPFDLKNVSEFIFCLSFSGLLPDMVFTKCCHEHVWWWCTIQLVFNKEAWVTCHHPLHTREA